DVPHALAPHLRLNHLDATLFADDAAMPHALVLAAIALVVLGWTEDLGAEQPIPLGLERAVVDGLRFLDLAVAPRANLLGRRDGDAQRVERDGIFRLLE